MAIVKIFFKSKKAEPHSKTRFEDMACSRLARHESRLEITLESSRLKDQMRMGKPDLLNEKLGVVQGGSIALALLNNAAADVQVLWTQK